jgi:hypothetical protein
MPGTRTPRTETNFATRTRYLLSRYPAETLSRNAARARAYIVRNGITKPGSTREQVDEQIACALYVIVKGALPTPRSWENITPRQVR